MDIKAMWKNVKTKIVDATSKAVQFAKENPEACSVILSVGTAVIGGVVKGTKMIRRCSQTRQIKNLKERYIYDRSLGMYLKTRRPLRNNDYVIINARKRHGEKLSDILSSMGLLE